MTVEDQLRDALAGHVADVRPPADRWSEVEAGASRVRTRAARRRALVAVVTAAAVVARVLAISTTGDEAHHRVITAPASTAPTPPTPPTTSAPVRPAPDSVSTLPTVATPSTSSSSAASSPFPYQAMWPFRTTDEAKVWQSSYRSGGHQPWHLDAAQTALSFTTGYLGFSEINVVVRSTTDRSGAHVAVGFVTNPGQTSTSAVIHLARYGSGTDAPWEVVGTDDSADFSVSTPRYGALTSSPFTAGGAIMGVDENIKVEVFQPSTNGSIGGGCCSPAGNSGAPWRLSVTFRGATDPVLTVAASTGGHFQQIERFTVTAIRLRP